MSPSQITSGESEELFQKDVHTIFTHMFSIWKYQGICTCVHFYTTLPLGVRGIPYTACDVQSAPDRLSLSPPDEVLLICL